MNKNYWKATTKTTIHLQQHYQMKLMFHLLVQQYHMECQTVIFINKYYSISRWIITHTQSIRRQLWKIAGLPKEIVLSLLTVHYNSLSLLGIIIILISNYIFSTTNRNGTTNIISVYLQFPDLISCQKLSATTVCQPH